MVQGGAGGSDGLGVAGGRVVKRSGSNGLKPLLAGGDGTDDADGLALANVVMDEVSQKQEAEPKSAAATVSVRYSSLPRASKERLEEMLFEWLDWHRRQPQARATCGGVERLSGEVDVFDMGDTGEHRVWADRPRCTQVLSSEPASSDAVALFNYESRFKVPQYDRACVSLSALADSATNNSSPSVAPGVSTHSRCFNCGSYG